MAVLVGKAFSHRCFLYRRRFAATLLLAAGVIIAGLTPVLASQKRVALVIGNSRYQHTTPLANPKHDAHDIAQELRKLSFTVIEKIDLDKTGMDRTVRDFAEALSSAKLALFFYAGHGLQVNGQNYMVPVDARLSTAAALDFETVRLDLVQRVMEREVSTNLIILDACRDNPLARNLARALGTRSSAVSSGLAAMESGQGTLIAFSTQPGNVALDGSGRNSPFAGALLKHMITPEDIPTILINVRNDVITATGRRQVPWEHSSLTSRVYFTPPQPLQPAPQVADQQLELTFWESVKDSTNPAVLQSYLDQYPQGAFAPLARALIEQYKKQQASEEAARKEAAKQAELKRIDEERKLREAALAEERRRAEATKDAAEAQRLTEQQRVEELKRAEELRKLLEEVRLAREAAKRAEEERLAALKAAEEARNSSRAGPLDDGGSSREAALAPLPNPEGPAGGSRLDGEWIISFKSPHCKLKGGQFVLIVKDGDIRIKQRGDRKFGKILPEGDARWTVPGRVDNHPLTWIGKFSDSAGSGTFVRQDRQCAGTFTAQRLG